MRFRARRTTSNTQPIDSTQDNSWHGRLKAVCKAATATGMQLLGTSVRIVSEIFIFAGGMAYIIAPPLKKMWNALEPSNFTYNVTLSGDAEIALQPSITPPVNNLSILLESIEPNAQPVILRQTFNKIPLANTDIPFGMSYPESIFVASILLLSIGSVGIAAAHVLQKYGAILQNAGKPIRHSEQLVSNAKRKHLPLSIARLVLLVGSRGAALYATTTFSLMNTLSNVPGIMQDFSINSPQNLHYIPSAADDLAPYIQSVLAHVIVVTYVGLNNLRNAAIEGSKDINAFYLPIALICAGVALILGFIELKASQKLSSYTNTIQRHKHYAELDPLAAQTLDVNIVEELEDATENSIDSFGLRSVHERSPNTANRDTTVIAIIPETHTRPEDVFHRSMISSLSLFSFPSSDRLSSVQERSSPEKNARL